MERVVAGANVHVSAAVAPLFASAIGARARRSRRAGHLTIALAGDHVRALATAFADVRWADEATSFVADLAAQTTLLGRSSRTSPGCIPRATDPLADVIGVLGFLAVVAFA
jgi:hypothetical protein